MKSSSLIAGVTLLLMVTPFLLAADHERPVQERVRRLEAQLQQLRHRVQSLENRLTEVEFSTKVLTTSPNFLRLDRKGYEAIERGMEPSEVRERLGPPHFRSTHTRYRTDPGQDFNWIYKGRVDDRPRTIIIVFHDGVVRHKSLF